MTLFHEESFEESLESMASELVLSSHELGDFSCSTASLRFRFKKLIMTKLVEEIF